MFILIEMYSMSDYMWEIESHGNHLHNFLESLRIDEKNIAANYVKSLHSCTFPPEFIKPDTFSLHMLRII